MKDDRCLRKQTEPDIQMVPEDLNIPKRQL